MQSFNESEECYKIHKFLYYDYFSSMKYKICLLIFLNY